jgi:hypothetical protein
LDIAASSPPLPCPFRLEEFWTHDPTCDTVIKEAQYFAIIGSLAYCLIRNLKNTKKKKAIKFWNKHHFGNIGRKLDSTLQLLDITQQAIPSDSNLSLELHLKSQLNEYMFQEESLWKNKSKELWLTSKDLNTRFFHTSTLIRQRRNAIDCLKYANDGWINDRNDIGGCFISNFKDLFTSSNPSASDELLDMFHCFISDEDNKVLCAIPTESENIWCSCKFGYKQSPRS